MKKIKHSVRYFLPIIVLTLLFTTSWRASQSQPVSLSSSALPHINLPSLLQPTNQFTSRMLQGKVSLLNIWASWCPACRSEHSTLMTIKNSVPIYGIIFKDNAENAKAWLRSNGNPYTSIGADPDGTLAATLGVDGIPETFLIDKQGRIRYSIRGTLNMNLWKNTLQPLIAQLKREQ